MRFQKLTKTRLRLDTTTEFKNWLAGLFDGEGNFSIRENGKNPQIRIVLEERDKFVLERIQNEIGGSLTYRKPLKSWKPHWHPQWEWRITSQIDCKTFTEWILPCLILKHEKAFMFLGEIQC